MGYTASRSNYRLEINNEETIWIKKGPMLLQVARKSKGTRQALDAYKLHLEQSLEEYDLAVAQLERVEKQVRGLCSNGTKITQ
jgi:hypothetical protein